MLPSFIIIITNEDVVDANSCASGSHGVKTKETHDIHNPTGGGQGVMMDERFQEMRECLSGITPPRSIVEVEHDGVGEMVGSKRRVVFPQDGDLYDRARL